MQSLPSSIIDEDFFSNQELLDLDKIGLADVLSASTLRLITENLHQSHHETMVVCTVCDQICRESKTTLFTVNDLPPKFFTVLLKPAGKTNDAAILHPQLCSQFSVAQHFRQDGVRFRNLLLSPRGLELHRDDCTQPSDLCCVPKLHICKSGCIKSIRKGTTPNFAIAQGNWIGQLPLCLRNMTYGTLSLLRPIQSFGRMVSYSSSSGMGGTRLTGNLYSTKLNTTLVRSKIPLHSKDDPVKCLVVSPFASDKSAAAKEKMANTKQDYIIEPDKIEKTLGFW